jgi:hypothetical protein
MKAFSDEQYWFLVLRLAKLTSGSVVAFRDQGSYSLSPFHFNMLHVNTYPVAVNGLRFGDIF